MHDVTIQRRISRKVPVADFFIGGGEPVFVQSMTSVPIEDIESTLDQIQAMAKRGARLVRCALRNEESAEYFKKVVERSPLPLCADIHFNYRIALRAIEAGAAKIRINPGNIGSIEKVREVVNAARGAGVPIRIGVNGGSLDRKKYPSVTPENLVNSALDHVKILEDLDFFDTVVSIKASDLFQTITANNILASSCDYPIHLGLTEAGYGLSCVIQSSITLGNLLYKGIGDTIRVSMTGDPVEEVVVGQKILQALGLAFNPVKIISCPTCGRTDPAVDLLDLAMKVEEAVMDKFRDRLDSLGRSVEIAVMGCEVNGPGEARDADIGLAGAHRGEVLIFARGEKIDRVPVKDAVDRIIAEMENVLKS